MTDPEKPVEVPRDDAATSHSTLNQRQQKCLKRRRNPLIWGSLDPPRGSELTNVTEQLRKKTPLRFASLKI